VRVAIAQVDSKWPNLALAKLASRWIGRGYEVELFNPLLSDSYDMIYASKVFKETPDDPYLPESAVRGGSGYSLSVVLPEEIEDMKPNWLLWPWWQKDIGYSTRGCIRSCSFCNVREKDGPLRVTAEFGDLWTGRRDLVLLDANITAAPMDHLRRLCADATVAKVRLDYSQGLDARLLTDEHVAIILAAPHTRNLHLAFDHPRDERHVRRAIALFQAGGFLTRHYLTIFVLVGYDTTEEEDLHRIEVIRSLGANPFVMKYDRHDPYQKQLSKWVNRKAIFRSCAWDEFRGKARSR